VPAPDDWVPFSEVPPEWSSRSRVGQPYTYISGRDRFFDDVLNVCVSLASFTVAGLTYNGNPGGFGPSSKYGLPGLAAGVDLLFDPNPLLEAVAQDERPTALTFWAHPAGLIVEPPSREPWRILTPVVQAAFVHYYESVAGMIVEVHGDKPRAFPEPLRFGWVVRNACAHDGRVLIKDENLVATWYGLTYRRTDNGRQIIHADLTPADLIVLMEEMDDAL